MLGPLYGLNHTIILKNISEHSSALTISHQSILLIAYKGSNLRIYCIAGEEFLSPFTSPTKASSLEVIYRHLTVFQPLEELSLGCSELQANKGSETHSNRSGNAPAKKIIINTYSTCLCHLNDMFNFPLTLLYFEHFGSYSYL